MGTAAVAALLKGQGEKGWGVEGRVLKAGKTYDCRLLSSCIHKGVLNNIFILLRMHAQVLSWS